MECKFIGVFFLELFIFKLKNGILQYPKISKPGTQTKYVGRNGKPVFSPVRTDRSRGGRGKRRKREERWKSEATGKGNTASN